MPTDAKPFAAAVLAVATALFLTYHGYWTPGGDSDLYAAVARNLARGDGFTYANEPVKIIPPGWPIVLAGLMRFSVEMGFLKLAQMLMLGVGLLLLYPVLRRYASPRLAATGVGLTAFMHPVYPLATWMHTEPLFVLLGSGAMLTATLFSERGRWPWLMATVVLLSASVFVRYSGIFGWIVVAAILASRVDVRWSRRLGPMAISGVTTIATLALLLFVIRPTTEAGPDFVDETDPNRTTEFVLDNALPPSDPLATRPSEARPDLDEAAVVQESRGHGNPFTSNDRSNLAIEYATRVANTGLWASWALFYPSRFASGLPGLNVVVAIIGWLALAAVAVTAGRSLRKGHYLPLGVLAFVATFALLWPNPNARYLVPVLPLLVVFVWQGVTRRAETGPSVIPSTAEGPRPTSGDRPDEVLRLAPLAQDDGGAGRRRQWGVVAFAAMLVVANAPLFLVDATLAKRPSLLPGRFEAGHAATLVAAADHMRQADVADGQVAVSNRHINFDKIRPLPTGSRAVVVLLDVAPRPMPGPVPDEPWDPWLAVWMSETGTRFYLYQEPAIPWRLWHFTLPEPIFERLSGREVDEPLGGWQLWELVDSDVPKLRRIELEPTSIDAWPHAIPQRATASNLR
ncbi:MAG: hypothetical protein AAGI46_00870 [Planctomycetota bacterium]